MSDEVIHTNVEPVLTKISPDILSTFKGIDMSKIQPVDMTPSCIKNISKMQNVKVITPEERAKPIVDELKESNNLLREQLQQSESMNKVYLQRIDELEKQARQLNDKEAYQTMYIKELKADLKEEMERRVNAESKLSSKDLKLSTVSLVIGVVGGLVTAVALYFIGKHFGVSLL